MGYVGKSMCFMNRLKNHIYNAKNNKGIFVDKKMYLRIDDFSFYEIATYKEFKIDFFTRQLETIIEREFVHFLNTLTPYGYNQRI